MIATVLIRVLAPVAVSMLLIGQQAGTFSAVSIRPSNSELTSSETKTTPGRVRFANTTTKSLIMRAFGAQEAQIVGAPSWTSRERFDILAVTNDPEPLGDAQRRPFLQALLAERFRLIFHKEPRQINVLVLKVDSRGSKLRNYSGDGEYSMKVRAAEGKQILESTKGNVTRLVEILSRTTGKMVVDQTGLHGDYNFTLEWEQALSDNSSGPSLNTALREQLGLVLENAKRPIEVFVVDQIAHPSEN